MPVTRRDFLKASSALAAALGVKTLGFDDALGMEGAPSVVWLQGQNCTGCSVSLLNTIYYMTIDTLLLNTIDLNYHPNVMAAAGPTAIAAAEAARAAGGYVLVVEGAIPTAQNGQYAYLWPGLTVLDGVRQYAANAGLILAVGSCAAYGGMAAGAPNPTGAQPVSAVVTGKTIINLPGCPAHPDWIVGTVAGYLSTHAAPALDSKGRPTQFYGTTVHDACPHLAAFNQTLANRISHAGNRGCFACHSVSDDDMQEGGRVVNTLGVSGCLFALGCKGRDTGCDCPTRKWNGGAANTPGVSWCIDANAPCIGCTEPGFPDTMSPFYLLRGATLNRTVDTRSEPAGALTALALAGPSSVQPSSSASFTATASYSDATTADVSHAAQWSVNSANATITATGRLTVGQVAGGTSLTVTATYLYNGVTRTATKAVAVAGTGTALANVAVSGPSSVNENSTASFQATAILTDGTTQNVTALAQWSEDSPYALIAAGGVLTTSEVASGQTVNVTATYTLNGVTRSATKAVRIANVPAALTGLILGGPASLNEHATANFSAAAKYSDNSTQDVTAAAAWSVNSSYATINAAGVLSALEVPSDQQVTVTAQYTESGVTQSASRAVTILNVTTTLTGLTIAGPTSLKENTSAGLAATARFADGSTQDVTNSAIWTDNSAYATISGSGVLTAGQVPSNQTVNVTARYSYNGVTRTATRSITIVNVPPPRLQSLTIAGPSTMPENSTAAFTATATFNDGSTADVTGVARWSEGSSYAAVTGPGQLSAGHVSRNRTVTLTARYTANGVTRTDTQSVTILHTGDEEEQDD